MGSEIEKKTEFAIKHAIDETVWTPPGYVLDGLGWLAADEPRVPDDDAARARGANDIVTPEQVNDRHE